jgi:hypothetical protein
MIEGLAALIGAVLGVLGTISLYGIRVAVMRRDVNAMAADGRRNGARITRIEHSLSRLDQDFEPYDTPT